MYLKLKLPAYTYNHSGLIKYLFHFIYFLLQWPNKIIFRYVQWFDITNWHLTLSILNTVRKGELLNIKEIFQIYFYSKKRNLIQKHTTEHSNIIFDLTIIIKSQLWGMCIQQRQSNCSCTVCCNIYWDL
jgi:hypothetical protein